MRPIVTQNTVVQMGPLEPPQTGAPDGLETSAVLNSPGTGDGVIPNPGLVRALTSERLVAAYRPARNLRAAAAQAVAAPRWSNVAPLAPTVAKLVHGIAPLDCSGRVYDAAVFTALGWTSGTALTSRWTDRGLLLTAATQGALVEHPAATFLDQRGRLKLPLTSRRRLELEPGDPVWLLGDPQQQCVLATSCRALDLLGVQLLPSAVASGRPLTIVGAS
jgi:hypothetical protein